MKLLYQKLPYHLGDEASIWQQEAICMESFGFSILYSNQVAQMATLLPRGYVCWIKSLFAAERHIFLNGLPQYSELTYLSRYFRYIHDLTIPTVFVDKLDEGAEKLISDLGWSKVFIKKDSKSLFFLDDCPCIWPNFSLTEISSAYEREGIVGKYALRQFIDSDIFYNEERYFVLNGKVYHRNASIPDIVTKAVERLSVISNRGYTIDVAGDIIVELNPIESADRYGDNSLELFCSWFADAYLHL